MKYTIEVEIVRFDAEPQYLAELKRDGNKWTLRVDADRAENRRELNEIISNQLKFASLQLASAATGDHVWPKDAA